MKDYSKSLSSSKTAVRQTRGPGMNLGLKKRPRPKKPKPFSDPWSSQGKSRKKGSKGKKGGLLKEGLF